MCVVDNNQSTQLCLILVRISVVTRTPKDSLPLRLHVFIQHSTMYLFLHIYLFLY